MKSTIRVFKTIDPHGFVFFEYEEDEAIGVSGSDSIPILARHIRGLIRNNRRAARVGIIFAPSNDIDCLHTAPRLCLPLSEEERHEFWKHFIAPETR